MTRAFNWIIISCLFATVGLAQQNAPAAQNNYARVDQLIESKNDSLNTLKDISGFINTAFQKNSDKARAIFVWITQNISYSTSQGYVSTNDSYCNVANNAFQRKAGVCMDYAVLFDTLCKLTGITSHIVEGSTRQIFLTSVIGHAWNAIQLDGSWQLIDATWGSGYLNGQTFIRQRNDFFYLTPPEKLIATHLPMDPIWQLLKRPVTLQEFQNETASTVKTDWNYNDSIAVYLNSSPLEQIKSSKRRLKQFGVDSEVTANYYIYLKSRETDYYTRRFNVAVKDDNEAVILYNNYVNFKNKQFKPAKPDKDIAAMLPAVSVKLDHSEQIYRQIVNQTDDTDLNNAIKTNLKHVADLQAHVKTETDFVNKYLGTQKNKRRDLFYTKTYTLFGIPVK